MPLQIAFLNFDDTLHNAVPLKTTNGYNRKLI